MAKKPTQTAATTVQEKSLLLDIRKEFKNTGIKAKTSLSKKWFKSKIKELGKINRQKLMRDSAGRLRGRKTTKPMIGRMYTFFYQPKTRDTLPYYDRFPLIILVDGVRGGFHGINLHYLHPEVRKVFFYKLLKITNNKKMDETTKMKISYELLSGISRFKQFAPTFKMYLGSHLKSQIMQIDANDWEAAIWMPTELFVKSSKQQVWNQSKKFIGKIK